MISTFFIIVLYIFWNCFVVHVYKYLSLERNGNEAILIWARKNIIMSAWLWVLLLAFHHISFFVSVIPQAWLQWLAELEMDSSPQELWKWSNGLQNCKSWVTSIEFPKARFLLPTVLEWRKWKEIALTTLRNPALFVKYDNYFWKLLITHRDDM